MRASVTRNVARTEDRIGRLSSPPSGKRGLRFAGGGGRLAQDGSFVRSRQGPAIASGEVRVREGSCTPHRGRDRSPRRAHGESREPSSLSPVRNRKARTRGCPPAQVGVSLDGRRVRSSWAVESSQDASNGFLAVAGEETSRRPIGMRRLANAQLERSTRQARRPLLRTGSCAEGARLQAQLSRPVETGCSTRWMRCALEVVLGFAGWNISAIVGPREGPARDRRKRGHDDAAGRSAIRQSTDSDQKPKPLGCLAPGLCKKGCRPTRHVRSSSTLPNPERRRRAEPAEHQKPSRWSSEASVFGRKSVPDA